MKINKFYSVALFLIGGLLFASCEKDDKDVNKPSELKSVMSDFKAKVESIKMPNSLKQKAQENEGAKKVSEMFIQNKQMIASVTSLVGNIPSGAKHSVEKLNNTEETAVTRGVDLEAKNDNEYDVWRYSQNGYEFTYAIFDDGDKYKIAYFINGNNLNYLIVGYVKKDQSESFFKYYLDDKVIAILGWKVEGDNGYFKIVDASGFRYESIYNFKDYSGEISYYYIDELYAKGYWTAIGTGGYISYVYSLNYTW